MPLDFFIIVGGQERKKMERCNECKMCDAIITIERRVVALEEAAKENQCGQAPLHTTCRKAQNTADTVE